jgi:glycosyltransferase involved in cell wall biosynthesis
MKLIAVIMVYNCGEVLPDTLRSIDGLVDEIRCFDGRYAYHKPIESLYSTDDTRAIIENFAFISKSKITYNQLPSPMYEADARTFSIQNIEVGDWVFVIDSDERVVKWGNDVRFTFEQTNELAYFIFMNEQIYPVCRFFRKATGMEYYSGDKIASPTNKIFYTRQFKPIEIYCIHEFKKRTHLPPASTFAQGPHP